jgi:hypothetical protein
MKRSLLLASLAISLQAFSQPVIADGSNIPSPGLAAPVSFGTPTAGIGSPGANQTWDFSLIPVTSVGTLNTIDPATSTFAASFPTADYAYELSGTYSYFALSASQMEVLAFSITSPGTGNDFTPNPRTILKFPFSYNDSQSDTWQIVSGSTNNVTITYDGYGTLFTPSAIYTNVVRVKEDYGSTVDYVWYITNPLMAVLHYKASSDKLYFTNATQITGIADQNSAQPSASLYPNPAKDNLTLQLSQLPTQADLELNVFNAFGQQLRQIPIHSLLTNIGLAGMSPGIYFYQLQNADHTLKTGKIIVE